MASQQSIERFRKQGGKINNHFQTPLAGWLRIRPLSSYFPIDLVEVAKSVGFKNAYNYEEVNLKDIFYSADASFIVYKTDIGNSEAPVIDLDPITIKERFMKSI